MSLQWADFPSGQKGLYGTSTTAMLEGTPWVDLVGGALIADPDTATFPDGIVFVHSDSTSGPSDAARIAVATPHQKMGIAARFWAAALPSGTGRAIYSFNSAANSVLYSIRIEANGSLRLYRNNSTLVADSVSPVVFAGSWNHLEIVVDVVTGVYELRKEGLTVFSGTDGSPTGGTVGIVAFPERNAGQGSFPNFYCKDLVVYNGAGSTFNDFIGSCQVNDLYEDADVSLGGWTANVGSTGYDLIRDTLPSNTLTASGAISNGEQVRINSTYYNFTTGSVDTGTPAGTSGAPWLVAIGVDDATSLSNLYKAIGATGVAGTDYSTALTAHTTVTPLGLTSTKLTVIPTNGTTTSMTFSETGTNLAWASTTTLSYGATDASYISADDTPPSPAECTLTDLDPDVTSVKGLMSIIRAFKSDGGDGTLQVALSPDGTNYDNGTDRAVTTTPTFYWDTSEVSPATAVAWTPAEANSVRIRFDRTT